MKSKLLDDGPRKTWALIMASGDEAASSIAAFALEKGLRGSHFRAIGGLSRATLACYDREMKTYLKIPLDEQVAVLSLIGDIAIEKSEPKVHAHVVAGLRDGATRGGLAEPRLPPPDPDPVYPPSEPEPDAPEPNVDIPPDPAPLWQMSGS